MLTPKRISVLVAAVLLAGAAMPQVLCGQPTAKDREANLIAVLKSDVNLNAKADACRELARVAGKDAVPVLAALLDDEKLAHMARYALETVPDPSVDEALRQALGKLKGLRLVGVIGSIGVRHDAQAVDALIKLLGDADADVAQAAARALGSIATPQAVEAIQAALPKTPQPNQLAFCEGLLRCAESLSAKGEREKATAIYDGLRALAGAPHQVRTAALRGAILMRGADGLALLVEAIRGKDFVLVEAAARAAMELPGPEVTRALADELAKLPPDTQILVTQVLGKRGDAGAVPALLAAAKAGDKTVRIAAIRALPEIGGAAATAPLLGLLDDAERDVAQAAQDALAALTGPQADAAIVAMLKDKEPATRQLAIELIGQRRILSAIPALLEAAGADDEAIRLASIKAVGALAGEAELPTVIELVVKAKSPAEIQAAQSSLSAICNRMGKPAAGKVVIVKAVYGALPNGPSADVTEKIAALIKAGAATIEASNATFGDPAQGTVKKLQVEYRVDGTTQTKTVAENDTITFTAKVTPPACIDAICAGLAKASTQPKIALLGVLRATGSPKALQAVRDAAGDPDAEVKDAAISLLCEWPTPDALDDVMRLAKTATDAKVKILALRGALRLIPIQEATADKKLAELKVAMALAQRTEEKRLALAALSAIPDAGSLAMVMPQLSSPDVKEEACLAAVAIAEKLPAANAAQVAGAMDRVLKATSNPQTTQRANALLAKTKQRR